MSSLQYRKLDFEEFTAAALSVHQLEAMDTWELQARSAYELFEKDGNKPIIIEELASVFFLTLKPIIILQFISIFDKWGQNKEILQHLHI